MKDMSSPPSSRHGRPPRLSLSIVIATVWWFVMLVVILLAASEGNAQPPGSALGAGTTGAPGSSLHDRQAVAPPANPAAPTAPAWTPRTPARNETAQAPQATPLQQANLPADLAKLSDAAIIIIGGKPMSAADVKRGVMMLDDHATIIVGGKQVGAGSMKRELQAAGTAFAATAAPQAHAPSGAPRSAASAGKSIWPQAPEGQRAVQTAATPPIGIHRVNWTPDVSWSPPYADLKPGQKAVINGIGFGGTPGQLILNQSIVMLGSTPVTPGSYSTSPLSAELRIDRWSNTTIEVVVLSSHEHLKGVPIFTVVRADGTPVYQ